VSSPGQSTKPYPKTTFKTMDHPLRDFTRSNFLTHLGSEPLARNCERSVLNWTVKKFPKCEASWDNVRFSTAYKQKVHALLAELKRSPTKVRVGLSVAGEQVAVKFEIFPQLVYRLKFKELESAKIATYSPDVLWPEGPYSTALFKVREKDMMFEAIKAKENEDYTGLLKCGKCKSTKTSYYQMQTRSADEPMVRAISLFLSQLATDSPSRQPSPTARIAATGGSSEE